MKQNYELQGLICRGLCEQHKAGVIKKYFLKLRA